MRPTVPHALAGLWAGAVLGGSLVAAPAKFQAESLTLDVALDVGRAQFFWLALTEAVLCLALLASLVFLSGRRWIWALFATGLLVFQRLVLMPPLDARTLQVIAGEPAPDSSLHTVFIVIEIIKFFLLTGMAAGLFRIRRKDSP